MRKLERMIRKELESHPGWEFIGPVGRQAHYVIAKGGKKLRLASSPRSGNTTVIQNLRQEIRRIERGQWK